MSLGKYEGRGKRNLQQLSLLGINHKTAPIELREKVYIPETRLSVTLAGIKKLPKINECLILSTCNRTEVYLTTTNQGQATEQLISFLVKLSGLGKNGLRGCFYKNEGLAVVDQIMRVAAGIDSMIVGEGQVLKQVKDAFQIAQKSKATGALLNTVFNRAISAGKRARAETDISRGAVSVSSTAVALARNIFEDLSHHQIMIIGAGKMSELAAKQLISCGIKSTLVSNRTFTKAQELAVRFAGTAVRFDDLEKHLSQVDIVISSTGAPHFLLKQEAVAKIMARRFGRPIFFIDIAVPRDIDPKVGELEDVFLYDIDDLGKLVEVNKRERAKEIPKVEKIIFEEKERLMKWYNSRLERGGLR